MIHLLLDLIVNWALAIVVAAFVFGFYICIFRLILGKWIWEMKT